MKTTIRINASSLPWTNCLLRWHRSCIQGIYEERMSANIIYGIATASFLDTMFKTHGNLKLAREAAVNSFRLPKIDNKKSPHLSNEMHMLATCMNYWDDYITQDTDHDIVLLPGDIPATEVSFSINYYEDDHVIVYLEGTLDKLVKIRNGCYAVGDYKTTSMADKEKFLNGYELSSQLKFYILAMKLMAEMHPDSALGQIGATRLGAFIDGIFIKPKLVDNSYARSDVWFFSEDTFSIYRRMLDNLIKRLSGAVAANFFPPEGLLNGSCEGKYSLCPFAPACKSQSPTISELILNRDFKRKEYKPLHHNENTTNKTVDNKV